MKAEIQKEFFDWVRTSSGKEPSELHPLVLACLDDAAERFASDGVSTVSGPERMKQLLDYWSSNVYMIIERGAASDVFRGVKLPDAPARTAALKDFYDIRNACYAGYFREAGVSGE